MELFTKSNTVKLRSHLKKFLVADDDQETIRQSRKGDRRQAIWTVETVVEKPNLIRLRSCHGTYLTASNKPLLLGMTGEKVTQTPSFNKHIIWQTQWEPERNGGGVFNVKLKSWCGKWLRANGGTPPWRNSVTHDEPHTSKTKNWLVWDVISVDDDGYVFETISSVSSSPVSSYLNGSDLGSRPGSPAFVGSVNKGFGRFVSLGLAMSPRWSPKPKTSSSFNERETLSSATEFFQKARAVRFRNGNNNKYLTAEDDEETVTQTRNGSSKNARWTVEPIRGSFHVIRLKSCYGKYLTASNERFLLGATGKKVIQLVPIRLDSSVEWEPVKEEGSRIRLRTRYGNYLRGNGGVPPWRNSVTHDNLRFSSATQDSISWDVDIVEILLDPQFTPETPSSSSPSPPPHRRPSNLSSPPHRRPSNLSSPPHRRPSNLSSPPNRRPSNLSSPSSSPPIYKRQSNLSSPSAPPLPVSHSRTPSSSLSERSDLDAVESLPKSDGRTIYYHIADVEGHVDDESTVGYAFTFKGNTVAELTRTLREETCLEDAVVCTRSPLNGKLFPLRLQLPPNNGTMHVVLLLSSSSLYRV